jgi:hypothetical protein
MAEKNGFWKGFWVKIGGRPVDLNAGMIEAVTNPPIGFVSKRTFVETDITARIKAINWFANCGKPISLDLSMGTQQVNTWQQAVSHCKEPAWGDVTLEAQNQLTLWLHLNARDRYRKWNEIVCSHKESTVTPLSEKVLTPFQTQQGLDAAVVQCATWDMLGALMENTYMNCGHSAFFFLELLLVYEAGHFPCGWLGDWPHGKLIVY